MDRCDDRLNSVSELPFLLVPPALSRPNIPPQRVDDRIHLSHENELGHCGERSSSEKFCRLVGKKEKYIQRSYRQ